MAAPKENTWKDIALVTLGFISMAAVTMGSLAFNSVSAVGTEQASQKAQLQAQQKAFDQLREDIRDNLTLIREDVKTIKSDVKNLTK